ncbi:unnamed protein product [Absidia cylindrospora]
MAPPPSNNVRQLFKQQQTQRQQQNKIDHVFAKYDSQGKLGCVLCKLTVKNEQLWTPHLQSAKHKQLLAQLKAIKQQQQQKETARKRPAPEHDTGSSAPSGDAALLTKRARFEQLEKEMEQEEQEQQEQQQQGGSDDDSDDSGDSNEDMDEDNDESGLPADFFDTPTPKSTSATPTPTPRAAAAASSNTSSSMKLGVHRDLPSGFFDDANEEAKARQVDAPEVMEDQQLDEDYAAFKEMMVDTNEETDKMIEIDEETILLDREVTLAQQQLVLDQKVQYLKQLRQQPHLLQTKQQQQSSMMDDHGDTDAWTAGLKSSVRTVMKQDSRKQAQTVFDDMDDDDDEEDEEEDSWRAQHL